MPATGIGKQATGEPKNSLRAPPCLPASVVQNPTQLQSFVPLFVFPSSWQAITRVHDQKMKAYRTVISFQCSILPPLSACNILSNAIICFYIYILHLLLMKTIFFVALSVIFASLSSFAQSDTTIRYYGKNGKETNKDSAVSYVKFFKQANMWHGMEYYMKRGILKSEGDYNEMNLGTAVGTVSNYKEDGKLDYESEYSDGKILNKTYYYNSGKKKSYTAYSDKGVPMQKGWDENGKELKDFVIEREARFKGGEEGWKKYLEKNLSRPGTSSR
jgi:hypothetical protein